MAHRPNVYVLYHENCYDGFGAAYAAWRRLGNDGDVTYLPVTHGKPMPKMEDSSVVFILDFSYPKADLLTLAARMEQVVVLDHHKTALEDLGDLANKEYGEWDDKLSVLFDMDRSGAMMAWEYFHDTPAPPLIHYVQDRDLWRFALPESREVAEALRGYPMKFSVWEKLDVGTLAIEGRIIARHTEMQVRMMCNQARLGEVGGMRCPIVNASGFWSEIGHQLLKDWPDYTMAASYFDRKDGIRQWSLRSRGDFDVSAVAKMFGGGGHAAAAGFSEVLA